MQNNGPNETHKCSDCGWIGLGDDLELGEDCRDGYDLVCPKCGKRIDFYQFPICKSIKNPYLSNPDQLPDIRGDQFTFTLFEDIENGKRDMVIKHDNLEIWRESLGWEYYMRFMEIGKVLKQKYGDRLIEFVHDNNCVSLLGDSFMAQDWLKDYIEQFPTSGPNGPVISKYF